MNIDPRFCKEAGVEIFTGNELLVKGALETEGGVHLMTGYPGSPVSGFFDTLQSLGPLLNDKGVVAKIANNEALSVAMVNGAQMAGCRAITAFKSVGMHVASDALALGALAGTQEKSGGLIVTGDDPWSDSTQVPADSRFLAEHLRLPVVEPSSPQEVKDWVNLSFKIGSAARSYICYLVTVAMVDGGGTVECYPNHYPKLNEHQKTTLSYERDIEPELDRTVLLPPRTWQREEQFEQRFNAAKAEARWLGLNRVLHRPQKGEVVPMGFVASGVAYAYLRHALAEMGLTGRIPILKLGMSYPLDERIVTSFARQCRKIVVVEERRSFVERQVVEVLQPLRQSAELDVEIYGKQFPGQLAGIPSTRGLNPSILIERLAPLLKEHAALPVELTQDRLAQEIERVRETSTYQVHVPERSPTFCPGCPHRDSSSVLLELRDDLLDSQYMLEHHKRGPVDMVAHGDTGCYTMLMYEPNKPLMHNYSGMGLGGGTGSGVDPFIDNKQIVFMGDGTFFHSGQVAISHSIKSGQDITYIILENKTTAMTGHQTHPGVEHDLTGNARAAQDIERIVKGMVTKRMAHDVRIVRINPEDRERYRQLLEQTILADGVKIVIADKECGITLQRRERAVERQGVRERGFVKVKRTMNVATEVCEHCLECTTQTGCPGLKMVDTDYGPKVQTDLSWCVNDGACHRVQACPAFEEVTIHRKSAPRAGDEHVDIGGLPEPSRPIHADQETWRCYLAGVGGMGIGLCTAILVTAGNEMGYHVQFLDKKGLAIRNGGVFSQVVFTRVDPTRDGAVGDSGGETDTLSPTEGRRTEQTVGTTAVIPYGKADLILGVDLMEAVRGLDPLHPYRVASPDRTAAVINTAKSPTVLELMGREEFEVEDLESSLKRYTRSDAYFGFNVGDVSERLLDSKLYANIMMLGIAFQKGFLPLTAEAIEQAIRTVIRHETERNLRAFHIGRRIVVHPDKFVVEAQHEYESAGRTLRRKVNSLSAQLGRGRHGRRTLRRFRVLARKTLRAARAAGLSDELKRDIVIRAADCMVWGGIRYAEKFCAGVLDAMSLDDNGRGHALTRAVVWNLAKVMLIKDEIYVAAMLTHPDKYKRDRRRFRINPAAGDRIVYRHMNRPEFELFGKRIRFNWTSRDWQLRLMSRMRFLRRMMPAWHQREREFREWYEVLLKKLEAPMLTAEPEYNRWVAVLSTPGPVTGYREVRYPKMDRARRMADQLLAAEAHQFEPKTEREPREQPAVQTVHLPVLTGVGV